MDDVDELVHRHALAGQRRFFDLEAGALKQTAVRRDGVARLEQHHVADDEVFALDLHDCAAAQDLGGGRAHLLQGLDRLLGLALLIDAEHGVDDDDKEDDEHVGGRFALVDRGHGADGGGGQQDEDHRVGHLHEEPLDERILLRGFQLVLAVLRQPRLRLGGGKTLLGCGDGAQDVVSLVCVEFHGNSFF